MSGPGEAFTLLESGTSRMHFKLAKALEDAASPLESDFAIQDALAQIRTRLASKSSARHFSELVPPLLTLLHCLHHYPSAGQQQEPLDVSFALIPTLQLLGLATDWNDVLLAHQLLPFLLERRPSPLPISSSSSAQSRSAHRDEDHSSSLLLLNTFRASLGAALVSGDNEATPFESSPSASSSRSRSRSRSPSWTRPPSTSAKAASSRRTDLRAMETLKSLANGIPQGPAVLPSLASTLVALTRHPDSTIRSLTLDAMLSCASFSSGNQETDADGDMEGQKEMLEAALTIVRLVLASTYAFSAGSDIDEQDGVILAEMERRVDPNPAVLRSCLRIIERARMAGLISSNELACHIVEILQATRWLPMHLELNSLQQIDVPVQVKNRTEGLRARAAIRQRGPLQEQHNYYGTYAPWLTEACLAALSRCAKDLLASSTPRLEPAAHAELLKSVLRIYNSASQGKAAALALCVAAARCIGTIYSSSQVGSEASASLRLSAPGGIQDGETAALWSALTQHTRSQLGSTNPDRKAAAIMLLDALLPVGWADQNTAAATGEVGEGSPSPPPVQLTEEDMAQLMALLADSDSSIRKRALGLLHRVDAGLTSLMRTQLQSAVDTELLNDKETLVDRNAVSTKGLTSVALRLLEVVSFSVQSADGAAQAAAESELERAVISLMPLRPFGSFDSIESSMEADSSSGFLWQLQTLPLNTRLALMRRLLQEARSAAAALGALHLLCTLLADVTSSDFRARLEAPDSFRKWIASELLGSHGIISLSMRASGEARALAASREAALAITARSVSLMLHLGDSEEASLTLATCLDALQLVLSKLIETESIAAIRLEASNLQLICRTILHPAEAQHKGLMDRIKTMASACQTIADSAKWLLTLEVDQTSASHRKEDRIEESTGSALLTAASRFFAPSSTRDRRTARSWTQSASSADSFAAVRLRERLPDSLLQSSVLLSPGDSTATLRSSDRHSSHGNSKSSRQTHQALSRSAIPSEVKRTRDRRIADAMSESIANLVLGSDAHTSSSENEIIFSATSSGVLEGEELELVEEVADPERRLGLATDAGEEPSLLDLVHQCHNHDPWLDTSLTPFILDGVQIGFLPARVVKACMDDSARQRKAGLHAVLRKVRFAMHHREIVPPSAKSRVCEAVTFTAEFATEEARTRGLNEVAQRWRKERIFPDPLDGWRDEHYAIYGLNPRPGARNPIAFKLERAACALFGLATFGVHLTAYTVAPETGALRVWVPQRSSTKSTWPGYLDNSVAGGIVAGDLPMESVVRECEEEANLEATLVEKHIKQTGVLSYCYKTSAQGWIQPEVEYVYDLPLPSDVVLQPKDGEVDHFELLTLDQIYEKMRQGRFKANCVLVILDFLIRHGYITADKEPGYRQIVAQLHVDLRLPGP